MGLSFYQKIPKAVRMRGHVSYVLSPFVQKPMAKFFSVPYQLQRTRQKVCIFQIVFVSLSTFCTREQSFVEFVTSFYCLFRIIVWQTTFSSFFSMWFIYIQLCSSIYHTQLLFNSLMTMFSPCFRMSACSLAHTSLPNVSRKRTIVVHGSKSIRNHLIFIFNKSVHSMPSKSCKWYPHTGDNIVCHQ